MKTRLAIAVSTLLGFLAVHAAQAASAEPSPRILELLSLIDRVPKARELEAAGVDRAGTLLVRLATDSRVTPYVRMRSASILGQYTSSDAARVGLERLVERDGLADDGVRVLATHALARFDPARVTPIFEKLLVHRTVDLRRAAIGALAELGAKASLRRRLFGPIRETDPDLLRLIAFHLERDVSR